MLEQINTVASKSIESLNEAFKETSVKDVDESPIQTNMETIENISLDSLKAQNDLASEKINAEIEQIKKNREDGADREAKAHEELKKEFPEEDGYKIEREQYLRDKDGKIVKDPETGEARRIDFIVIKDGKVIKSIEVTSETAPKDAQIAKEDRIREAGGNYIKDRDTGELIEMPENTRTEVRRYP